MKKTLFLFLTFFALASLSLHKYYHSHCSFELNEKTGNGEVVIELFSHDVEAALLKSTGKKISAEDKDFSASLTPYIKEHFVLKNAAQQTIEFDWVGSEIKKDQLEVYLEYKGLKSFEGLMLTNSLLTKSFASQINKVNLKKGEWKKSLVYTAKVTHQKLIP